DDGHAIPLQFEREVQWSLSTELHDNALRLFLFDNSKNVFQREWFEVQAIGSIVVGRNRFWIAVHHDGFVAICMQSKAGVAAAEIEFDSLPDTIRATAQNHDLRT